MFHILHRCRIAALAAIGLFCTLGAFGAETVSTRPDSARVSASQGFVNAAAHINMAEIQIGKLALEKSSSPEIKNFAQHLVTDHSQNLKQLEQLAANAKLTLPTKLDRKHQAMFENLQAINGAQFDKQFSADMVKGHEAAIRLFDSVAKSNMDPTLKSFASSTLPTLRDHLKMAQDAQSQTASAPGRMQHQPS